MEKEKRTNKLVKKCESDEKNRKRTILENVKIVAFRKYIRERWWVLTMGISASFVPTVIYEVIYVSLVIYIYSTGRLSRTYTTYARK